MTISASLRGALCASASVAAVFAASGAAAQATNTSQPAANSGEVVVTARRTAESIRTVPLAVSAFGAQKLKEENITQTRDLMFHVTGLYMGGAADMNNTVYQIRGVGPTGQQGEFNPGVMSYFAEVPLPVNAQSQPQYDLANIQVLKGPQGTLFGKNTTGGAVLVYPQTPNYRGVNGYLQGTFGSYNWREFEGAVNIPLVEDKLALRIAAHDDQRDGYIKNITPGGPDGSDVNNFGVRVQLRWDPTVRVSNNLMFDYYKSDTAGNAVSVLTASGAPAPATPGGVAGTGSYYLYATPPGFSPYSKVLQWGVTDRLEVRITPNLQFVNIAAYRTAKYNAFDNGDGTSLGLFRTRQDANEEDWTEEAQLKGHGFDNKLDWIVGGFYAKTNPLAGNDFYNIIFGGNGGDGYPFLSRQSEAIYGNATVHLDNLLQGLEFDAGLRYTWDQFSICTANVIVPASGAAGPPPSLNFGPGQCGQNTLATISGPPASGSSSAPTWSVGLNWKVNNDLFLYGVTRRGYRAGGINGPTFAAGSPISAFQSYKPEIVTDFEFGERYSFRVGGMRGTLDMDYFHAQTDNVQQGALQVSTQFYNLLAGSPLLPTSIPCGVAGSLGTNFDGDCNPYNDPIQTELEYNAGSLVAQGFEFQATISPIENLTFSAGGTIDNFKFSAGNNAVPAILLPYYNLRGFCVGQSCLAGNFGATETFTAGVRYSLPLSHDMGTLVFNTNAYLSSQLSQQAQFGYLRPPYNIINMRLDWNHMLGGPIDASLFIQNLSNTVYGLSTGNSVNLPTLVLGEPRMIGGTLRWQFGS